MPSPQPFPATRASVVSGLTSDRPAARQRALEVVAAVYWSPVHALLRARFGLDSDSASDLTQDFFAAAIEKEWLSRYDPARARFRTFLRTCVLRFAANARQASRRLKRGGGADHVPLDEARLEGADDELERLFEGEWVRSVLELALRALHEEASTPAQAAAARLFERYHVEGADTGERPTHADLAAAFELPVTQVNNLLAGARRRFRGHVLDTLRALTGSDEEFRAEARALLGVEDA